MVARSSESGQTTGGILGIGIDVVELDRMKEIVGRWGDRFVHRVFAGEERIEPDSPRAVAHYAARFAAKEAFLKALGTGLADGIAWRDVWVRREPSGAPRLEVRGRAEVLCRQRRVGARHVSLTHSRETAVALVILERR